MQNTEFLEKLEIYRAQIDAVDIEIMQLLAKRFGLVGQVGALKAEHGLQGSYIRPAREAIMLRKLLNDARTAGVPQSMVAGIWRLIIGASTAHESPLNVVHLSDDVQAGLRAAQYFSDEVPQFAAHMYDFWTNIHVNEHSIFVVPYNLLNELWRDMPNHLRVFAQLPFFNQALTFNVEGCSPLAEFNHKVVEQLEKLGRTPEVEPWGGKINNSPTYLAIANIIPELTGDDVSLFHDGVKLVEVAGFTQQLKGAVYLGTYAKPYII